MHSPSILEGVPVQALGPRPPELHNIRLGLEDEKAAQQQSSFLSRYVSKEG